jgi:Ca-activated chloride channel family protein
MRTAMTTPSTAPPLRLIVPVAPRERPVELTSVHVSAEVSGALVVTTWELVFHNPNARELEGQLEFPLLAGQSVIRFAMDVGGELREAVPVPKDKGRQVFEEIVRRKVDPGLLEKTAGNSYRARVYPLLPHQHKRVVIAYQEEVDGGGVYRLALDLGKLQKFSLELAARGPAALPTVTTNSLGLVLPPWRQDLVTRVEQADFTARGLLELALPPSDRPAVTTQEFADKTYFRAEQAVELHTRRRAAPQVVGLVWDCSGSADGRDIDRELAALGRYLKAVAPVEVRLVALRDQAEPTQVFQVDKGGDWKALRDTLELTCWDGATALGAWTPEAGVDAWLLCSDGLINFGAVDAMPDTRGAPLHVLSSAARSDPARLQGLADRSGGEFVDLLRTTAEAAAAALMQVSERILAVETSPREVAQVYPEAPAPLRSSRLVVAGLLRGARATVRVKIGFQDDPGAARTITLTIAAGEHTGQLAARAWAALKIASLEPLQAINAADIERTGQEFGIVTRSTSLIILDGVEDYARYDITPPDSLRAAWDRLRHGAWQSQQASLASRVERVVALFRDYVTWWERDFSPKPPEKPTLKREAHRAEESRMAPPRVSAMRSMPAPAPMSPAPMSSADESIEDLMADSEDDSPMSAMDSMEMERSADAGPGAPQAKGAAKGQGAAPATIQLQKWEPNAAYLDRLRRTDDGRLYHVYLEERPDHARSTAFFLDAADVFFERGQPALALRILSNLAEMELENPAVLRILGYRLLQADRPDLARPMFEQVRKLRPEEPQSHRDLAQACAASGDLQAAVDLLWQVASGAWDSRFPEIELIALIELNAIVATSPRPARPGAGRRARAPGPAARPARGAHVGRRQHGHRPVGHRPGRREGVLRQPPDAAGRAHVAGLPRGLRARGVLAAPRAARRVPRRGQLLWQHPADHRRRHDDPAAVLHRLRHAGAAQDQRVTLRLRDTKRGRHRRPLHGRALIHSTALRA